MHGGVVKLFSSTFDASVKRKFLLLHFVFLLTGSLFSFRAHNEYQQQVARIAQLEAQLNHDGAQKRVRQLERDLAVNQVALRTFLQNSGHFLRSGSWRFVAPFVRAHCFVLFRLADDAPFDAQCLARWIGDSASGSVDDFMLLAGRAIAFAQLPVAPAPLVVAPGTASARPLSAPPTGVLGVSPVAEIDSGAVAPLRCVVAPVDLLLTLLPSFSVDSAPPAVVLESSQESPVASSGLGSCRLLRGSHLKKIPLVLRSRAAAVAPGDSAAATGSVAPE